MRRLTPCLLRFLMCQSGTLLHSMQSSGECLLRGGVILIALRIIVLYLYPYTANRVSPRTGLSRLVWVEALFFQAWLRYLGTAPISQPYVLVAQIRVLIFFTLHLTLIG